MTISRADVIKLLVQCRLAVCSKESIREFLEEPELVNDNSELELKMFEILSELYRGNSNGYLSDLYEAITGDRLEVVGDVDELYKCPCCGYRTLTECYDVDKGTGYDICDYCRWEDDGTKEVDQRSSVNRGSIREYRAKIEENRNYYYRNRWFK